MGKYWKRIVFLLVLFSFSNVAVNTLAATEESVEQTTQTTFDSSTLESTNSSDISNSVMDETINSTTSETQSKEKIDNLNLNKELQPLEKYAVVTPEKSFYYETLEDALTQTNSLPISNNQLIRLTASQSIDLKNTVYQFIFSSGKEGFIYQDNFTRSESENFLTLSSNKNNIKLFKDLELNEPVALDTIINRTYRIKETLSLNNQFYFSLFNVENQFVGFIQKDELSEVTNNAGSTVALNSYINISDINQDIYKNTNLDKAGSTSSLANQTLLAKEIYYHFNGENYVSLYDNQNIFKGLVNEKFVTKNSGKQGSYQKYDHYVLLTKKNYDIWQNFSWKPKSKSNKYENQTLLAKGIYYHFNGNKYLSLYNSKNEWLGYINTAAVKILDNSQGEYNSYNKFVTIKKNNYPFWNSFSWDLRSQSTNVAGKTFKARGIYYHFNGEKYLSIYDNQGKWLGYMNAKGTSVANGAEGVYQNFNQYVSVTSTNYPIWQNFKWKQKNVTKTYNNQTVYAKGIYHHYNGESYYSLYNNKSQWLGYVNKNSATLADGAQGIYHSYWKNVTISNANYPVWKNFKWENQTNNIKVKGKSFMARGIYYHYNGASYYSLYQGNKWVGYINSNAAFNYDMNKLIPNYESLLAVHQIIQQKILDTSSNPNSVIDRVLNMPITNRNQIVYNNNAFVVSLKGKKVGLDEVKLTVKEIAPGVNYSLLPADQIQGAIPKLNKNKKYVALTFDDGPNPYTTPQLLNTLKQKNVKATFFMLGSSVNSNRSLAKRVANEGHQIGSHSYSHPQLTSLSNAQINAQMKETDKAIYLATGKLPKTFRPPYGAINQTVSNIASKPAILWSIDTRDWESRNPVAINNVVNQNIHNGAIILLHDIHQPSVNSVPTMIDNLKRRGYEFVTIDELLEMNHRPLHGYFSQTNNRTY